MEAAPTPKPPTSRPAYIHPRDPLDPACKATPTQVTVPAHTRGHFLPNRSATRDAWVKVFSAPFRLGPGSIEGGMRTGKDVQLSWR